MSQRKNDLGIPRLSTAPENNRHFCAAVAHWTDIN
jgi:hypothetical protein